MNSLASALRSSVLSLPEVTRSGTLRRSTSLFAQGDRAEALYFIEEGLVKLTRANREGGRIILTIRGADQLVGEESLVSEGQEYYTDADVITTTAAHRIPRSVALEALRTSPELATTFVSYLLSRRLALAEKVELLCLHDVEYRILHYLAELSSAVNQVDGEGYQLPLTQLELADLIGATRETTSTTLNQLERRGLVKLSRRMLTVPSPEDLKQAAESKANQGTISASQ